MPVQKKKNYSYHQPSLNNKTNQNYFKNFSILSCFFGLVFVGGGVAGIFFMKSLIQEAIASEMVLKENGRAFAEWKDPEISPLMNIYFFNLTNADMFLAGKEKPRVSKIGPYVYTQEVHKVDTIFGEDGNTVTYSDNQTYFFNPIKSKGEESDVILLPNLPLFGAMRNLTHVDSTTKNIFEDLIGSYQFDKKENAPFLMLTVKEFLWSYPSLLMTIKERESEGCKEQPKEKSDSEWGDVDEDSYWYEEDIIDECTISQETLHPFGFFLGENGTAKYTRTLMTGKTDIQDKGLYRAGFGKELEEDRCNIIQGRDPECPTINIDKDQNMDLYFLKMCRSIKFENTRTVNHGGIDTLRFSPSEESFNSAKESPENLENSCHCQGETCQPKGVLDVGVECNPGSPVYISWPHFLHGDPQLRDNVLGISPPTESEHGFYMDFEPEWGIPLSVRVMLQFNVLVENNGFSYFNNIDSPVLLPFLYIDAGFQEPSQDMVEKVNMLLSLAEKIKNVMVSSLISMGVILMFPLFVFWTRYHCCYNQKISQSENIL